jgi:hypothetical protein
MIIKRCDICGRNEFDMDCRIEKYKLKKEQYSWYDRSWQCLDICSDCLSEIRRKVRGKNDVG